MWGHRRNVSRTSCSQALNIFSLDCDMGIVGMPCQLYRLLMTLCLQHGGCSRP